MDISVSMLVEQIKLLDTNKIYSFIYTGNKKHIKINSVDLPAGPVRFERLKSNNEVSQVTVTKRNLEKIAASIIEDTPFSIDSIVSGSGSWRAVFESILAHTPEFYFCKVNGQKRLVWHPSNPHEVGLLKQWQSKEDITNGISTKPTKKNLSLSSFITDLSSTGLIFSDQLVTRFVLSLLTKPFVILSGLAGSGKTQLAISFARWICEKSEEQICIVPVGADWTNREFLLGYPNALNNKEYVKPDNGVLDLLINANMNKDKPYFLILDEMNLSYVERYFADFLSAMESCEKIPLMKNSENNAVPESISLPKNLFIIGTINVDETTYMFSPKVLDRANVVEFRIMPDELDTFFKNMKPIDKDIINGMGTSQAYSFVEIANSKADIQTIENRNEIILILKQFFIELKNIHAEFGYRTANEMFRFMSLGQKLETSLSSDMIVDAAIIQKLLPKLHGSRKKIEPVLKALWSLCINNNKYALDTISELPGENEMKYPLSAEKIWRMYRIAQDNGFTSFAEA